MNLYQSKAILIIDAQLCAFEGTLAPACYKASELLLKIATLLEMARNNGTPVIFIQHCGLPGQLFAEGADQWCIHPQISPTKKELVIQKRESSAFSGTELEMVLANMGVDTIITCGLQSEHCVSNTCLAALALGMKVQVVSDAHSTWSTDQDEASEIIRRQNQLLASKGVVCQPLAEYLA